MVSINPICAEQSIIYFINKLSNNTAERLYESVIILVAQKGELRYTDKRAIGSIYRSADNKHQITYFWREIDEYFNELEVYVHEIYPSTKSIKVIKVEGNGWPLPADLMKPVNNKKEQYFRSGDILDVCDKLNHIKKLFKDFSM